jgi:ribosomal subunit interface protein
MQYSLRCEHLTLSSLDEELIEKKLQRLEKYASVPYVMDVTFLHTTHQATGNIVECRLTIKQGKQVFHAERTEATIQEALDAALHALRQELTKYHDKTVRGHKG